MVRMSEAELVALDIMISQQEGPKPSRPEAIRQMLRAVFNLAAKDALNSKSQSSAEVTPSEESHNQG